MKKAILTLAVLCGIALGAAAQSVDANKPAADDTLFLFVYEKDSIFVTSNDITSHENDVYCLTAAKFKQLDAIQLRMGQYVGFYGKSPSGTWETIRVQYLWDSFFPTGVRMLHTIPCDSWEYEKVVFANGDAGCFHLSNGN